MVPVLPVARTGVAYVIEESIRRSEPPTFPLRRPASAAPFPEIVMHLPHPHLDLPPCPWLPEVEAPVYASSLGPYGNDRGPEFYAAALCYAHSLWLQGFPARAILLLNRALGSDIPPRHPLLHSWPLPYRAVAWLLRHHRPEQFIGNPRRHWQHLATRMSGPRSELRTWRAWACWHMARTILPDMPADDEQIAAEGITEPTADEIAARLDHLGHPGETAVWQEALETPPPPSA